MENNRETNLILLSAEMLELLMRSLPYLDYNDAGPTEYGWQSDALSDLNDDIKNLIEKIEGKT